MVFLSRYVVGGVARNVQGNEHLALLPIPFQLPVVGAQEKEGREAGVVAPRRAHPQRRPQQQRQEESPRGPATALHAAARPERRSLIQFGRRRDGEATRREGEKAAEGSGAGSAAKPRREVRRETPAPKVSLGRAGAGPDLRAPRARRPGHGELQRPLPPRNAPRPVRGKRPPPPHLLKAPGAEPRPSRTAARVPAAPPPPSAAPRARAPPRPGAPSPGPRAVRGAARSSGRTERAAEGRELAGSEGPVAGHGVRESPCGT